MQKRLTFSFLTLAAALAAVSISAAAQQQQQQTNGPPPGGEPPVMTKRPTTRDQARPWHVRALVGSRTLELDSVVTSFEHEHFSADYMTKTTHAERVALMGKIRALSAQAGEIRAQEDDAGVHLHLDNNAIDFTIDPKAPFGITTIKLTESSGGGMPGGQAAATLTWDGMRDRLKGAEAAGFSGQVLARRDGKEVLRSNYGVSDKKTKRATTTDQVYCIGSTPIDFTVTAAQMLIERGKLALDDPISKFIKDVPADRAGMTIGMIMSGRSGLQNFHHTDADADPDVTYIDRATALHRITTIPLLFSPGTKQQHSHSAYVLLAAIIEIVSGKTYPEFVRSEIFKPLGMNRTGFYGETLGIPLAQFATGYGAKAVGNPNIPPKWGPTSWLVMGSGGMFSTLDDLRRYYDAVASGALFADKKPRARAGVGVGGSDRGFFFARIDDGKGSQVLMMTNTETLPVVHDLVGEFAKMVLGPGFGRGPGD